MTNIEKWVNTHRMEVSGWTLEDATFWVVTWGNGQKDLFRSEAEAVAFATTGKRPMAEPLVVLRDW